MQTFLPVESFSETATILDRKRLGKQRVETYQILQTLAGLTSGWANHPVMNMWRGCEWKLMEYGLTMCAEWRVRGYEDNMGGKIADLCQDAMYQKIWTPANNTGTPWWLGHDGFHQSHKSNLVLKDPAYYGPIWPDIKPGLPYVWPEWRPSQAQTK